MRNVFSPPTQDAEDDVVRYLSTRDCYAPEIAWQKHVLGFLRQFIVAVPFRIPALPPARRASGAQGDLASPVERLQWLQVPVEHQSRATRLPSDSSSRDHEVVDYAPPPNWINGGNGSRSRLGWSTRNPSLVVAIWVTVFLGFFLGCDKLTKVRSRMIADSPRG